MSMSSWMRFWTNVENTRIDSPDITAFEIAGSKARIDTQTHTIRLRKPAGQTWTSETPVIETNGDTYAELKSGRSFLRQRSAGVSRHARTAR